MQSTLHYGQRSQAVRQVQEKLNQAGARLSVDGHYGRATASAIKAYQRGTGLLADGVAGPRTLARLFHAQCEHEHLNGLLIEATHRLGVPLASLYAICEVESNGQGFLVTGEPVILFERHIMYRQLMTFAVDSETTVERQNRVDQLVLRHPSLINRKPGGYLGGVAEHRRLGSARLINEDAALQSASWGAFQIMGFHWQRLGYSSVQQFTQDMSVGYPQQLKAFVRFIETDQKLHQALQARAWERLAERYNGPNFRQNQYHVKLESAYTRHEACGCGARQNPPASPDAVARLEDASTISSPSPGPSLSSLNQTSSVRTMPLQCESAS